MDGKFIIQNHKTIYDHKTKPFTPKQNHEHQEQNHENNFKICTFLVIFQTKKQSNKASTF